MAKESIVVKESPVVDALRKLKEDEAELLSRLKPVQEAIGALEKIVEKYDKSEKPVKKGKSSSKDNGADDSGAEEVVQELGFES